MLSVHILPQPFLHVSSLQSDTSTSPNIENNWNAARYLDLALHWHLTDKSPPPAFAPVAVAGEQQEDRNGRNAISSSKLLHILALKVWSRSNWSLQPSPSHGLECDTFGWCKVLPWGQCPWAQQPLRHAYNHQQSPRQAYVSIQSQDGYQQHPYPWEGVFFIERYVTNRSLYREKLIKEARLNVNTWMTQQC